MSAFRRVALLQSHPRTPVWHDYYVPDLVELASLAAAIRPFVEEVAIPVGPTDRDPLHAFESYLRRHRPDLVGISSFTCGAGSARRYAALAHRHGAVVVMGGYHPSALPEEVLACPDVDVVVRGEGEATFAELVRTGSPEGVAGTSFRRDGQIVHNPAREPIQDLDALPRPLRELRPRRCGLAGADYHTDTVYASRGCRGRCVFCANHLVGGAWRPRRVDAILAELFSIPPLPRGRRKKVKFWDSSFLAEPERVETLCQGIIEHGLDRHFRYVAESRAEDVVRGAAVLPIMQRASFARIGCGVESPNRRTHATLRKGLNLDHVGRAAELLAGAGLQFSKFLIVGHEGEDEADILAYPEYALSHGTRLQNTTFFIMTPYPGTELAARMTAAGTIASRNWDLYTNHGAVISPGGIGPRRLQLLHAAVAMRYKCSRRFAAGRSAAEILAACFEPLLLLATVELQRDGAVADAEVAGVIHDALAAADGVATRPVRRARRRVRERLVACFHADGRAPRLIGVARLGDEERLLLGAEAERLAGAIRVHVSLERLVALARRLDHRRLAADGMTLAHNPRAFRLAWLPSFARELAAALLGLAGMLGFHLRRRFFAAFDRR
ncbi:MAG: B12-binding domain-containing radical SAM protein [Acidobacteria bacterium]|nr:B12-binding domain-containing radical SAM protein [Acidobacteriota bacterium]